MWRTIPVYRSVYCHQTKGKMFVCSPLFWISAMSELSMCVIFFTKQIFIQFEAYPLLGVEQGRLPEAVWQSDGQREGNTAATGWHAL